jgi:hypothetical protein
MNALRRCSSSRVAGADTKDHCKIKRKRPSSGGLEGAAPLDKPLTSARTLELPSQSSGAFSYRENTVAFSS